MLVVRLFAIVQFSIVPEPLKLLTMNGAPAEVVLSATRQFRSVEDER